MCAQNTLGDAKVSQPIKGADLDKLVDVQLLFETWASQCLNERMVPHEIFKPLMSLNKIVYWRLAMCQELKNLFPPWLELIFNCKKPQLKSEMARLFLEIFYAPTATATFGVRPLPDFMEKYTDFQIVLGSGENCVSPAFYPYITKNELQHWILTQHPIFNVGSLLRFLPYEEQYTEGSIRSSVIKMVTPPSTIPGTGTDNDGRVNNPRKTRTAEYSPSSSSGNAPQQQTPLQEPLVRNGDDIRIVYKPKVKETPQNLLEKIHSVIESRRIFPPLIFDKVAARPLLAGGEVTGVINWVHLHTPGDWLADFAYEGEYRNIHSTVGLMLRTNVCAYLASPHRRELSVIARASSPKLFGLNLTPDVYTTLDYHTILERARDDYLAQLKIYLNDAPSGLKRSVTPNIRLEIFPFSDRQLVANMTLHGTTTGSFDYNEFLVTKYSNVRVLRYANYDFDIPVDGNTELNTYQLINAIIPQIPCTSYYRDPLKMPTRIEDLQLVLKCLSVLGSASEAHCSLISFGSLPNRYFIPSTQYGDRSEFGMFRGRFDYDTAECSVQTEEEAQEVKWIIAELYPKTPAANSAYNLVALSNLWELQERLGETSLIGRKVTVMTKGENPEKTFITVGPQHYRIPASSTRAPIVNDFHYWLGWFMHIARMIPSVRTRLKSFEIRSALAAEKSFTQGFEAMTDEQITKWLEDEGYNRLQVAYMMYTDCLTQNPLLQDEVWRSQVNQVFESFNFRAPFRKP